MATILRLGSCRCGGAEKLDHDGAGWVMVCQTCGRQRYDWKGELRRGSMHKYTETPNPANGGGGIKAAITLEEALAKPRNRHPVVRWDETIHCVPRRGRVHSRFDAWVGLPPSWELTGAVEAGFLINGGRNSWVLVDSIKIPYSLESLSPREHGELRHQFRRAICQRVGAPCGWHDSTIGNPYSCRNVRSIPELALTWELDAPPLI